MFPRINSSLSSLSALPEAATRLVSKHTRTSLVAGTVVMASAFGAVGATAASASATPYAATPLSQALSRVSHDGQNGAQQFSVFGTALGNQTHTGIRPAATPAHATPATAVPVKLDARTAPAVHAAAPASPKPVPVKVKAPVAKPKPKPVVRRAPARPKAPVGPTRPYLVYDSVTPSAIPGGYPVAVYANGSYFAHASEVAHRHALWIDTNGSDPHANVLDVEPGDATPAGAAQWVKARVIAHHNQVAIVYTMRSLWPAVKANIHALPDWMQRHVRYWIADPTGYNHVVPGSAATQWYWGKNYDITTANPNFER